MNTAVNEQIVLDVREDIAQGCEPFTRIMVGLDSLAPRQQLLLLAPFEPVPLYRVLASRGFVCSTRPLDSGDFEVLITHASAEDRSDVPANVDTAEITPKPITVDARGLEPPEPLVRILEAVEQLPAGATLHAWTDRRPAHLYPQLTLRGCTGETEMTHDGSYITYIRRS
ncbi:MAG TPA: DUF2249 domain-containing protein [Methylomirabilota bacterium]|nr:DUF2249 domain-containing protein [Methylomirabilota bacterium]